ncbi:hypothetical protein BHE74_00030034 [Ensete ventricosum]|nr:hypothetical protein GW17_00034826 [Ensete ventricosum]RWW62825.1 hypothetical protein BHE74_00030034 [Ensete ventricosum]
MEVVVVPRCDRSVRVHRTGSCVGVVVVEAEETGEALRKARHKRTPIPLLHWQRHGDGWHDAGSLLRANDASNFSQHPPQSSTFLLWFGPTARLTVADPDLIREIFLSRSDVFERYESHPLVRQLEGEGLLSLRGERWAHHRKVLAPTFHMENLKVSTSVICC